MKLKGSLEGKVIEYGAELSRIKFAGCKNLKHVFVCLFVCFLGEQTFYFFKQLFGLIMGSMTEETNILTRKQY